MYFMKLTSYDNWIPCNAVSIHGAKQEASKHFKDDINDNILIGYGIDADNIISTYQGHRITKIQWDKSPTKYENKYEQS